MRSLSEFLKQHARGTTDDQAGQTLTELIASVMSSENLAAKGSLSLTISVARAGDAQVKIEANTKVTTPKGKASSETLWADEAGDLAREAPRPPPTELEVLIEERKRKAAAGGQQGGGAPLGRDK
jgi:hypothetical protein